MDQDDYFSASSFTKPTKSMGVRSRADKTFSNRRSSTILMALPKGAEGEWSGVDRNYVIGGNWKSNGDWDFVNSFPKDVLNKASFDPSKVEVVVAPTFLHLGAAQQALAGSQVQLSAQNCSLYGNGAFTGETSATMIKDFGLDWVILGHSERRHVFGESDQVVASKVKAALD